MRRLGKSRGPQHRPRSPEGRKAGYREMQVPLPARNDTLSWGPRGPTLTTPRCQQRDALLSACLVFRIGREPLVASGDGRHGKMSELHGQPPLQGSLLLEARGSQRALGPALGIHSPVFLLVTVLEACLVVTAPWSAPGRSRLSLPRPWQPFHRKT